MRFLLIVSFIFAIWPAHSGSANVGDECPCGGSFTGTYRKVTPGSGQLYCNSYQGE